MSTAVLLALAVGEPAAGPAADPAGGPAPVPLAAAAEVAAAAEAAGVAALRLLDGTAAGHALDPTVVAAYLAGIHGGIGHLAEIPTTHQAPYNTARRVLSLDRATGGRAGIALRAGGGDEVSAAVAPVPGAADPVRRWAEYARVLTRLWESFPRAALLGDQASGVVVDDTRIRPIDHAGVYYRVAGPLDGPASVQGRPVLAADLGGPGGLDAATVAESADVVVVDRDRAAGADAALAAALRRAGRSRREVALLGRVRITPADPAAAAAAGDELRAWAAAHRLDGVELVPDGDPAAVTAALRALVPRLTESAGAPPPTLRAALGLPEPAGAAA